MHRSIDPQSSSVFSTSIIRTKSLRFLIGLALLLAFVIASPALRAGATSWNVTDTGTLNTAISEANAETTGAHTITFDADITLTAATTAIDLQPGVTLIIEGQGYSLDGVGAYRGFTIAAGTVEINELNITNGYEVYGAGLFNNGTLTVTGSTFSNNTSTGSGGAIRNDGTLTVMNCTFSDNISSGGGGIFTSYGTMTMTDSTFSGNSALSGGGIYIGSGTVEVMNSNFSGNSATDFGGGGFDNDGGTLTVTNSTFSGNSAHSGGGIYNHSYGIATVAHSTFSLNSVSSSGGGIFNYWGTLELSNTILADSTGSEDCVNSYGTIGADAHNLIEANNGCGTPVVTADPNLGPLQDNGGPTLTHALLAGSPAIDAGGLSCPSSDQRGEPRPQGLACDIGAYESSFTVNYPPVAADDDGLTPEDTPTLVDVAANDLDLNENLDLASVAAISDPLNGVLENHGDGTFTYTPDPDIHGSDSFDYQICDTFTSPACDTATVNIEVVSVNDAPQAQDDSASTDEDTPVLIDAVANDSDVDGDIEPSTAAVVLPPTNGTVDNHGDGTFTYTPDADYHGDDEFDYQVCDSGDPVLCDTANVSIDVVSVNDAPVAEDDFAETAAVTAVMIDAAANDSDVDSNLDPSTATVVIPPSYGDVVNNGDGTFTYTPHVGNYGSDSFDYQICDTGDPVLCDTATVTVTVTSITVSNTAQLNAAITAANGLTSGTFTILFGNDILLDSTTTPVNLQPGVTLIFEGADYALDGADTYRGLTIDAGTVEIGDLTITNARELSAGGIYNAGTLSITNSHFTTNTSTIPVGNSGGGINNVGTLTISNSTFSDNSAVRGGGIGNNGTLVVSSSTLSDNGATSNGGGIYSTTGTLTVSGSMLSGNSASQGGGIYVASGEAEVIDSTLTGNSANNYGGGIYNRGTLTVSDSTLSDNSATTSGGGIYTDIFTLTVSQSTLSGNDASYGGGILIDSGTVEVSDSALTGNSASALGGGIYQDGGTLTISDSSELSNNTAQYGGGIYLESGNVEVSRSILTGNSASTHGGGIYLETGNAEVSDSALTGNSASFWGGGINNNSGTLTIIQSTLSSNTAYDGGGISQMSDGDLTIVSSTLSDNMATHFYGGGIYSQSNNTAITMINVILRGNSSGGGGGGMDIRNSGQTNLYNVIFDSNTASSIGGGLENDNSPMSLVNVTFANNSASVGGAIYMYELDHPMTVRNSVLWGNSAAQGSQIRYRAINTGSLTIANSLIQEMYADGMYKDGGYDFINGGGNLTDPPKFVDAAHGDLRLWRDSPTVNAGNNGFLPPDTTDLDQDGNTTEPLPLDIDGHPRVWNTTIDMGAHEAPSDAVLYVMPGAAGDCTSWGQACGLHTALSWAVPSDAGPGQVWIAAGTHVPTTLTDLHDPRSATFQLHSGVEVCGGFAGTETSLDQRDPAANITVLSGDIGGDDITDSHGVVTDPADIQGDNSYHVLSAWGVDDTALLDGFTITGGSADGSAPHHRGGGVLNDSGSPLLRNLTFWGNQAQDGAGMANANSAAPLILNSIFGRNSAENGGGMSNDGSDPELVNVIFNANTASGLGGGMFNADASLPGLVNLTFTFNQAGQGGALANEDSSPTLANSILWANTASVSGDQIFNDNSTPAIHYSLVQGSGGSGDEWDASLGSDDEGNLDLDPLFMEADGADDVPGTLDDDLRLQVNSPAIDVGDNDSLPVDNLDLDADGDSLEPFPYDMDEGERIFPNSDQLAVIPEFARLEFCEIYCIVNMGAYEAPPVAGYQEYMLAFLEGEYHLLEGQKYRRGFHVELDGQPEKTISEILVNLTPSVITEFNQAEATYLSAMTLAEPIGLSPQVPRARYLDVHWELATAAMLLGNDDMVLAMDFITQVEGPSLDEEIGHIQDALTDYQLATDTYLELFEGEEDMDLLVAAQPTRVHPVGVDAGKPAPCLDLQRIAMASAQKSRAYLELVERQFRKHTPDTMEMAMETLQEGVLTARSDLALMGTLMQAVDEGSCEAPGGAASFVLEEDESYLTVLRNITDMERLFDYLLEGKNPFGFDESYVPFHFQPKVWIRDGLNNYEQTKNLADEELVLAQDMVIAAENARLAFDDNQETLALRMEQVKSQYESQMVQLCGLNDSGDPDLEHCHLNPGGEVYQQLLRVLGANERVNLVILQMEHQLDLIRIEQERAARVAGIQRATAEMYLQTGDEKATLAGEIARLRFSKSTAQGITSILQGAFSGATFMGETGGGWGALFGGVVGGVLEGANWQHQNQVAGQIAEKEAEMERLQAFQSAQVHYAEAQITDANSEALQKQYFLRYQEYAVELAIAHSNLLQELARLDGMRNRLVYLLSEKARAEAYTETIYADPAFRVMRDNIMELAYDRYGVALEYAYRAGRALEYEINQDAGFTSGEWTELESIYSTRDVTTLQAGLGQMNTAYQEFLARPDVPFPQLREDVIYLSQALGFEDTFEPELGRVVTREEKFNAFIRDPANRDEDGNLRFTFQTSIVLGNRFFSTAVFNDKIVSIKMRVRGQDLGDDRLVISLKQSGTSFLRTLNAFRNDGPDDVRAYNLHALRATIMAATNESVLPDDIADNMELATRSVAFTNWTLTLDQIHEPNNFDVDINGIEEIEMVITHEAYTLQDVGGDQAAGGDEGGDAGLSIFEPPPNRPYRPLEDTGDSWYLLRSLAGLDAAPDTAPYAPDNLTGVFTGTAILTDPVYIPNLDLVLYLEDSDGNLAGVIESSILPGYPGQPCKDDPSKICDNPVSGTWDGFLFALESEMFTNPASGAGRQVFFDGEFDAGGQFLTGTYTETLTGLTDEPLTLTGVFRLSFSVTLTSARTIYVDEDASGANNGASWQDAFTELGQALEFAQVGDEIWVARGTYLPDYDTETETHTGDRTAAFHLKNDVALYGGFVGTETDLEARDWSANPTILSGDIGLPGEASDNSYHVVVASGTDTSAILDGFTITAGNADGTWPNDGGGGIFITGGNPTLANLTIIDNDAAKGGGMYNAGAIPTLSNVAFIGNSSVSGGGMYNAQSHPMLSDVTFVGNQAANGGGMSNVSDSSPELVNVAFLGNQATGNGGGLINLDGSSPNLSNVLFSGNQAQRGGGMYNDDSDPTLVNVTLSNNTAAEHGGGMENWYSDPPMANAILWGNEAPNSPQIYNAISAPEISYSLIQGALSSGDWDPDLGIDGGHNLDQDPLFVDADGADDIPGTPDDDLQLQLTSPAIDAGDNAAVLIGVVTDLVGSARFADIPAVDDTGSGAPPIVDMGAYEASMAIDRRAPVDFDADGTSDTVVFRSGAWRFFDYDTAVFDHGVWTGTAPGCIPAPMDYDGDGGVEPTQLCDGAWHFYNDDGSYNKGLWTGGVVGDLPIPADYDGDGTDDVVVWRAGAWRFFDFTSGVFDHGVWTGTSAGCIPAPMDFDGDGGAEPTLFCDGAWHFYADDGSYSKGIWTGGVVGDLPVPADYDGDGTEEIVIWRAGAWRFYDYGTGAFDHGVWTGAPPHWLGGTSLPAPLDYDGDGLVDFTVWSGGPWHFYNADGSYAKGIWTGGVAGDMPLSRRLLP